MKRLKILVITLLILSFCISSYAKSYPAAGYSHTIESVLYVSNLSTESEIAEQQIISARNESNSKVHLDNITINNSIIQINGSALIGSSNELPFTLKGEIKKIDTSESIIVASLTDRNNNFDIIHFSIDNGSSKLITVTGKKYQETTLNMYLQKKNTRDIIFIETPLPEEFLNKDELFNFVNQLNLYEAKDLFWYTQLFTPTNIEIKDISKEKIILESSDVGILGEPLKLREIKNFILFNTLLWDIILENMFGLIMTFNTPLSLIMGIFTLRSKKTTVLLIITRLCV